MTCFAGKDAVCFGNGYDLTPWLIRTEPVKGYRAQEFVRGAGNSGVGAVGYLRGLEISTFSLVGHLSDEVGGPHELLKALPGDVVLTAAARDAAGALAAGMVANTVNYPVKVGIDDKLTFSSDLPPGTASRMDMGRLLFIGTVSESGYGPWVDLGAGADDGRGYLQVFGPDADCTLGCLIEHSPTGLGEGEQSTLLSFTLDGTARGAERVVASKALERYVRLASTVGGEEPSFGIAAIVCRSKVY